MCVAGGYCPKASKEPIVCPAGHYCVTGLSAPEACLPGTYSNTTGLRRAEDCTLCPAGHYCDGFGLTSPRGACAPGFYCLSGCNTSTPHAFASITSNLASVGGVCPKGNFCPAGSALGTPCPGS